MGESITSKKIASPRVLVCSPTSETKDYCFKDWLLNVLSFTYDNFEIVLFENTTNSNYASTMNTFAEKIGATEKFKAIKSNVNEDMSVYERLAISHNDCAKYAIENNFDYILHLESDVFPQEFIIEKLLSNKKDIVGAIYYTDIGSFRKPMIQQKIRFSEKKNEIGFAQMQIGDDLIFIDGTTKEVGSVGLGCVLIKTEVLKRVSFRGYKNVDLAPDSMFSGDCHTLGIKIFSDTSVICDHQNQQWGIFGATYK